MEGSLRRSRLVWPNVLLLLTLLLHDLDHLRQGRDVEIPLSQGYPDLGVDALSWIAALVPLAAGLFLGFSGLAVRRADGATSSA